MCKAAVDILETALGPQPLHKYQALEERTALQAQLASALSSLAHMSKCRGGMEEAEKMMERALGITETALGPEHPQMGTCLNNLGMIYMGRGKYQEGQDSLERGVAITSVIYGEGSVETAPLLRNWAKCFDGLTTQLSNDLKDAEAERSVLRSHGVALRRMSEAILEGRYDTVTAAESLSEVAFLYQGLSRYTTSESLLKWVLRMVEATYGTHDYRVAICATNLAVLLQSMSPPVVSPPHPKLEEAQSLLERGVSITEKAYGKNHPEVAQRLNNLAMLLRTQGKLEEAVKCLERGVEITRDAEEASDRLGVRLDNLGRLYLDLYKYDMAIQYLEEAREVLEAGLPNNLGEVRYCLDNLIRLYRAVNDDRKEDEAMCRMKELDGRVQESVQTMSPVSEMGGNTAVGFDMPQHVSRRQSLHSMDTGKLPEPPTMAPPRSSFLGPWPGDSSTKLESSGGSVHMRVMEMNLQGFHLNF